MIRAIVPILLLTLAARIVQAQDAPARVLTDTPEYCRDLARRVAARQDVPQSARALSDEGQRLCAHGQVIAGIARLRRALVVMDHPEAP